MTALAPSPQASPAPPRTAWQVAAPALAAVLAAAGAAAVYLVFVRTTLGQQVDEAAMKGGEVSHPRLIEVLSRTLDGTSLISLAVVALVAAAIGLVRKRVDLAVAAGVLVLGSNVTTQALKVELARPGLDAPGPNSLPSGHTTAAVSVAFALVLVLPYAMRAAVALAGTAYVTVIAVATVWADWHRPSDTVAALMVVLTWGGAVVTVVRARRRLSRRRPHTGRSASRLATLPLTLAVTFTGAIGLIGLAAVALSETVLPGLVSDMAAFLAGSAGMAAAAAGTFLVWVRLAAGDRPLTTEPADGATAAAPATKSVTKSTAKSTAKPTAKAVKAAPGQTVGMAGKAIGGTSARKLLPRRRNGERQPLNQGRRT
jgi:membrane-associated phospholipid phosphatase